MERKVRVEVLHYGLHFSYGFESFDFAALHEVGWRLSKKVLLEVVFFACLLADCEVFGDEDVLHLHVAGH